MATEVQPSVQKLTYDQYVKDINLNSANKSAVEKIIVDILENPALNTFSEFLEIEEIKSPEYEKFFNTLKLFAFGTYRQYYENKDRLIELTAVMDKKLKHLTILALATQKKTLPYDELMVELGLKNVRDLEDLIIEAIYAELINGKLDQKNRQLEIDYAISRDIQTENIQEIVNILTDWLKSSEQINKCLEEQIENANAEKVKKAKHMEQVQEKLAEVKKNIKKQSAAGQTMEEPDGDFAMMSTEKNLNMKEKRAMRMKQHGGPSSKAWFKNFNN